jgi:hypothetical protein
VTTNDGDTTGLWVNLHNYAHVHLLGPSIPAAAIDPVNSCTAYWVFKHGGSDTAGLYWGSTGSWIGSGGITTTYTAYGGNWPSTAKSGIDGVGTKMQSAGAGTVDARCTYIYRNVDYTLGGGFLMFFSILTPLIGVGLQLADMGMLNRELRRRSHTRLKPSEFLPAWEEFRAYTHPKWVFYGA